MGGVVVLHTNGLDHVGVIRTRHCSLLLDSLDYQPVGLAACSSSRNSTRCAVRQVHVPPEAAGTPPIQQPLTREAGQSAETAAFSMELWIDARSTWYERQYESAL